MASLQFHHHRSTAPLSLSEPLLSSLSINSNESDPTSIALPSLPSYVFIHSASGNELPPPVPTSGHQCQQSTHSTPQQASSRGRSPVCGGGVTTVSQLPTPTSKCACEVKEPVPSPTKPAEPKQMRVAKKRESKGEHLKAIIEPLLQQGDSERIAEIGLKRANLLQLFVCLDLQVGAFHNFYPMLILFPEEPWVIKPT
ncbi:hypothetical protein SERLA73DRAFT_79261 [Serpula lacrymans var. lacrymans S7.3]|uniref:Uncharacterized protein n=2 Tax=Serpula lacrymans var. lacrymans TaxID=341189 RepID=F8QFV1_SERL3|nr:uncharacterized protein SERLADRAFT_444055 [Serpula lacrymans var. lacrymans S7.9]EGN92796.1 hypothetical protein SERLA73DRAFT_79261 [Serpula lacrymans var. lacrymans S7.3]EGO18469.1 hypothetical protein SERLADRAFT_444055 [Serpula lacrymans var. lacrymans S7.9]